jgi:LytS/YehU family sensor histidine kinase
MANKYLSQLGKFIRNILQNASQPLISSQEEKNMLEQYLSLEQARFNNSFQYKLEVDGNAGQIPSMLTFPFVEEALYERVLAGESSNQKKVLNISFTDIDRATSISISDNSIAGRKIETGTAVKMAQEQIEAINKGQPEKITVLRKTASGQNRVEILIPHSVLL